MIKTIDRDACRLVRAELDKVLPEIGKKLGLNLSIGSGTFCSDNVTFKVTAAVTASNGVVVTKEATAFKNYAHRFGLSPDDLGKEITYGGGNKYTIIGAKPRSWRFPIIAKRSDGKVFKLPADGVARALGKTAPVVDYSKLFGNLPDESGDSFSGFAGPGED